MHSTKPAIAKYGNYAYCILFAGMVWTLCGYIRFFLLSEILLCLARLAAGAAWAAQGTK